MPPPRPATEARSGSLESGRPSRARSANMRHPAGRPHTPPANRTLYATDVRQTYVRRQTASSLNAPWAGHNNMSLNWTMSSDEKSAVSRVISEIFNVEKYRNLEIRVKGQSRSLQVVTFDRLVWFPIYWQVAMANCRY